MERRVVFDFLGRDNVSGTMLRISERAEVLHHRLESGSRGMLALGGAASAVAGPAAAAGAAFIGFAAVAAPSIKKVLAAQEDLAAHWDELSTGQRASALQVKALTDAYTDLADSYEPESLAAFNTVLSAVTAEIPAFEQIVRMSAGSMQGLSDRFAGFVSGPVDEFLGFAARTAPQVLDQFGSALTTTGGLALQVVQDMAPLGMSFLSVANSGLSALNTLAHLNPLLTQFALTTLMLRGPIGAIASGVTSVAGRFREAAVAGQGLSRSARTANLVAAAGPAVWVTAAAAIGFFAIKAFTAQNASDKLVATLRAQTGAIGNNLDGYRELVNELMPRLAAAQDSVRRGWTTAAGHDQGAHAQLKAARDAVAAYSTELDHARRAMSRIDAGSQRLAAAYGLTKEQALGLANAAGVDLSQAVDKAGHLTAQAEAKIQNYRAAVEAASDPTQLVADAMKNAANRALSMKDRLAAVTTALDAVFNPAVAAFNATTQLKEAFVRLSEQLNRAHGRMDGDTAASRRLRDAFSQQLATVQALYEATLRKTGSTRSATAAVRAYIPVLLAMTRGDRNARDMVMGLAQTTGAATAATNTSRRAFMDAAHAMHIGASRARELWKSLQAIKSRSVKVSVDAQGRWTDMPGPLHKFRGGAPTFSIGGPVPAIGPAASRQRDSVPALLRVDEHVWTPEEVDAAGGHAAVIRLRRAALTGRLQGYARGGRVGHGDLADPADRDAVPRVLRPLRAGYQRLITAVATALAEAIARLMSGGGVVAAARSQIGVPYSWGGGGKSGPSRGIGRGASTIGFDCSGLTEYAWWQGRRVDMGGNPYEQHPRSRPIGGPRPGALGFPHLGHVVIASNRPGFVIEAPYTGAYVREARRSLSDWRWPAGAGYAAGGRVTKWGIDVVTGHATPEDRALALLAGIAGGRKRRRGGPVAPGVPYLVGEVGPEVYTPRGGGTITPDGTTVIQRIRIDVHAPVGSDLADAGRQITRALAEYRRRGGRTVP